MKRLINKLFEKLGYVPKDTYDDILATAEDLQDLVDLHNMAKEDIMRGNVKYTCEELYRHYAVKTVTKDKKEHCVGYLVKWFPFTDEDSKAYARICAEELCEKLNDCQ